MEPVRPDFADGRHLRRSASQEALLEAFHLLGHDHALDDLDAAPPRQVDDRTAGNPVKETVRRGRVQHAVLQEKHVGARCLGHPAAPVQHQRIGIPSGLSAVFFDRADHVETRGLRLGRGGSWVGTAILRHCQADAGLHGSRVEILAPIPRRDREIDLRVLRGNPHLLAATPGDRADIAIDKIVGLQHVAAGLVDLGNTVWNLKADDSA